MLDFKIAANYELAPVFREILGASLGSIALENCVLSFGNILECSGFGEVRLLASDMDNKLVFYAVLSSKGHESFAGNLYGLEVVKFIKEGFDRTSTRRENFPATIRRAFGKIIKIVGLGELREEIVVVKEQDEEEIASFFPPNAVLPDTITINKKTLEVIGFLFDTGKWLYIFSEGEGNFRMELDMDITAEELCVRWDYVAMEKSMQILSVFEQENTMDISSLG